MKQITINPSNEKYYSEDFIKGFKCGAERQLEADKVDIPHSDDWEKYSDKLWKNAYERGKADRPQEWIPCSERVPEEEGIYLVTATNCVFNTEEIAVGTCYFNIEYGFSNNRKILAWMPLPEPWKGADDE